MILYGLKTCDTCRKAAKALEAAGHEVIFRDVRAEPLDAGTIAQLFEAFGEKLVNRASTTWRGLDEAERARAPEALLADYPALMKRPVLEEGGRRSLGWDRAAQGAWL